MKQLNPKLKVVIVDQHFLNVVALRFMIKELGFMEIVGALSSGVELIEQLAQLQPDIVFLDMMMPVMDGITTTKIIAEKYPETIVIGLTENDDVNTINKILSSGVWAYITKKSTKEDYDNLFKRIMLSHNYVTSSTTVVKESKIKYDIKPKPAVSLLPNITNREKQVLSLSSEGNTDKQIAQLLNLSPRTIDSHKQNIMKKLGVRKSIEMVSIAIKLNII